MVLQATIQVCQLLFNLVQDSAYTQYLLELDASGYVEPPNHWPGSTYTERLKILQDHRIRLDDPKRASLVKYDLQINTARSTYTYAKGTYVQIVGHPDRSTQCFYFYQIPSSNRSTAHSHWSISDLGVNATRCEIDPEQDLLVLLEPVDLEPGYKTCKLYLRTMSTGLPHPKAYGDNPILVDMPASASHPKDNVHFEISGRLVAVMFRTRSSFTPSHVLMWDWITGTETLVSHQTTQNHRILLNQSLSSVCRLPSARTNHSRYSPKDYLFYLVFQRFSKLSSSTRTMHLDI